MMSCIGLCKFEGVIFGITQKPLHIILGQMIPHKKVSRDLTKKKQDLTEMSILLMVLTEI